MADKSIAIKVTTDAKQAVEGFFGLTKNLRDTQIAFREAQAKVSALAREMSSTENPSKQLQKDFAAATKEAKALAAGIDVKNLANEVVPAGRPAQSIRAVVQPESGRGAGPPIAGTQGCPDPAERPAETGDRLAYRIPRGPCRRRRNIPALRGRTTRHRLGFRPQIKWAWSVQDATAKSELWVATSNDRATAVRVFGDFGGSFTQQTPGNSTWYGWVRAVDRFWNYSEWQPVGATEGVAVVSAGNGTALQPGAAADHVYAGGDVSVESETETTILLASIALSQPQGQSVGLSVTFDYVGSSATRLVKLRVGSTWFTIYEREQDISARFVSATRFIRLNVPVGGAIELELVVKHVFEDAVLFESPSVFVMEVMG